MIRISVKDFLKLNHQYDGYILFKRNQKFQCIILCCSESDTIDTLDHEMMHGILREVGEIQASLLYDNISDEYEQLN